MGSPVPDPNHETVINISSDEGDHGNDNSLDDFIDDSLSVSEFGGARSTYSHSNPEDAFNAQSKRYPTKL